MCLEHSPGPFAPANGLLRAGAGSGDGRVHFVYVLDVSTSMGHGDMKGLAEHNKGQFNYVNLTK